jgi:hypothetical protein
MEVKYTKWKKNTPNGGKIHQIEVKYTKYTKMAIKYNLIFHSKAYKNKPKLVFLVEYICMYHLATQTNSDRAQKAFSEITIKVHVYNHSSL